MKFVQNYIWNHFICTFCCQKENQNSELNVVWCCNCQRPVFEFHERSCNARSITQLESTGEILNRHEGNVPDLEGQIEIVVVQLPRESFSSSNENNDGLPTYEEAVNFQY